MTDKLYYDDQYMKTAICKVSRIVKDERGHAAILDRTIFYPEGGGQPCDTGFIGDAHVYDVQTDGDDILHYFKGSLEEGTDYECTLDWDRRFLHMQLHLGQHLMSASAMTLYDANTAGIHIGDDYVTVDLDRKLTADEVDEVELLANRTIFANTCVSAILPSDEELERIPLRKRPKVSENIRIVAVNDFDYTPCGGTHPKSTGEVGIVKVRKFWNHKSGVRIEFVSGMLALMDYRMKTRSIVSIATSLSSKEGDVVESFQRMEAQLKSREDEVFKLHTSLLELERDRLLGEAVKTASLNLVAKHFDERDPASVRRLSSLFDGPEIARVFSTFDPQKSKYTLLVDIPKGSPVSARDIISRINEMTGGRGGGSAESAQTSLGSKEDLDRALEYVMSI